MSAADLDDFMLTRPLPSPWTAADIGAVGRDGDATQRNGRLVVRGSGANVFNAADSCHFLHQPLAGDLALTG